MRICFDGQIFVEQTTGGISRYFANLAAGMNEEPGVTARILAPLHRNDRLAEMAAAPVLGLHLPNGRGIDQLCRLALRTASPVLGRLLRPDIVHETYFSPAPLVTAARRRVTTVYDMVHEIYFPDSVTARHKRLSVARCDHVICISHNTKKDLCEFLDFPPEKASVTHLAYEDFSGLVAGPVPSELAGAPYFLHVGHRSGHKNFETLLRAFANAPELLQDFRIICFGGIPFTDDERALATELGVPADRLVRLGGGDALLGAAYTHAVAFVYPSLYEGFGIPPLEAMSAGCPVVSSSSSSLPEVVGDAALLFDPRDVEALRDAMERLAQSDDLRQDLIRRGHTQRKKFSWEHCVKETLDVYRQVL